MAGSLFQPPKHCNSHRTQDEEPNAQTTSRQQLPYSDRSMQSRSPSTNHPHPTSAEDIALGHWIAVSAYENLIRGIKSTIPPSHHTPFTDSIAQFVTQLAHLNVGRQTRLPTGIRTTVDLGNISPGYVPCALFLEATLPLLLHCGTDSELVVRGCTHPVSSRSVTYFAEVILPLVRRLGRRVDFFIHSFSFGDNPSGEVLLAVRKADSPIEPFFERERSPLVELKVLFGTNGFVPQVVDTAIHEVKNRLESAGLFWPEIETSLCHAQTHGGIVFAKAEYGNVAVGFERTVTNPDAFVEAAHQTANDLILYDQGDGCVGPQLSPFLLSLAAVATLCEAASGYSEKGHNTVPPRFRWTTAQLDPSTIYLMEQLTHLNNGVPIHIFGNVGTSALIDVNPPETNHGVDDGKPSDV